MLIRHRVPFYSIFEGKLILTFFRSACGMRTNIDNAEPAMRNAERERLDAECGMRSAMCEIRILQKYEAAFSY